MIHQMIVIAWIQQKFWKCKSFFDFPALHIFEMLFLMKNLLYMSSQKPQILRNILLNLNAISFIIICKLLFWTLKFIQLFINSIYLQFIAFHVFCEIYLQFIFIFYFVFHWKCKFYCKNNVFNCIFILCSQNKFLLWLIVLSTRENFQFVLQITLLHYHLRLVVVLH